MTRYRYPKGIDTFSEANLTAISCAIDLGDPIVGIGLRLIACIDQPDDRLFRIRLQQLRDQLNTMPVEREAFVSRYLIALVMR